MAAPPSSHLQSMLQAAVQSVQWAYSLFWKICPQQRILVWGDGYYNGAIKTRKTVQPMEVSAEDASLQRSQHLKDLYESLSAGETNQPTKRPCAALSPEDLTESEWFYLMSLSFSFPSDVGLPGKAYARQQHVWLTGANEIDSKTFSRAILAKSARIQTVVCIPLLDGVLELGTTQKVQEDIGFVQRVKSFFTDHHLPLPLPSKPALSEHSTSNPETYLLDQPHFQSSMPFIYGIADPRTSDEQDDDGEDEEEDEDEDEEDEEDDDGEEEERSDSEGETGRETPSVRARAQNAETVTTAGAEPSELMQLEMSEDIRLGSPDDGSNNLELDFQLIRSGNIPAVRQSREDSFRAESTPLSSSLQPSAAAGPSPLETMVQEDTHYSQTVSGILHRQPIQWAEPSSVAYLSYSNQSAFTKYTNRCPDHVLHLPIEGPSQSFLKYILFNVPYLHYKYREENSPRLRDGNTANRFRKDSAAQDELSANHVLAERRRREKLNERFIILRSLVPFVTKMDKASILGDTIEYVKQLREKIQELEARNQQMEIEQQSRFAHLPQTISSLKDQRRALDTRNLRSVEGSAGCTKPKTVETSPALPLVETKTNVEVSIIECDALLEMQCGYREGLLLDIMQKLRELRIETTTVQSSLNNGVFVAELRATVKDNAAAKKVSIMEVKRAIHQIIPNPK